MSNVDPNAETAVLMAVDPYPWDQYRHMHRPPANIPEHPPVFAGEDFSDRSGYISAMAALVFLAIGWSLVLLLLAVFGADGGNPQ